MFIYQGEAIFHETRRLSHTAETHREICTALTFAIPASLLAFDQRAPMSNAMLRISPEEGKIRARDEQRSNRMLMEFGGTVV